MGNQHSYKKYKQAKQVLEDYPSLILVLDTLIPALKEKAQYSAVASLIDAAESSRRTLKLQYDYYKRIAKSKGKISHG